MVTFQVDIVKISLLVMLR